MLDEFLARMEGIYHRAVAAGVSRDTLATYLEGCLLLPDDAGFEQITSVMAASGLHSVERESLPDGYKVVGFGDDGERIECKIRNLAPFVIEMSLYDSADDPHLPYAPECGPCGFVNGEEVENANFEPARIETVRGEFAETNDLWDFMKEHIQGFGNVWSEICREPQRA